jgi:hypothetical protein
MVRFNRLNRQEERAALLARDKVTGETMGAGDSRRLAEALQAAEEEKQKTAQEKQQAPAEQAQKEDQMAEKLARVGLEVKDKSSRFQGKESPVLRLLRKQGT